MKEKIKEKTLEVLRKVSGRDVQATDYLNSVGMNYLDRVEVAVELEDTFGFEIDIEEIDDIVTAEDFIKAAWRAWETKEPSVKVIDRVEDE